MKPFDLEAATRGEPIITRGGEQAVFLLHVPEARACDRVVYRVNDMVFTADTNGVFNAREDTRLDLFIGDAE